MTCPCRRVERAEATPRLGSTSSTAAPRSPVNLAALRAVLGVDSTIIEAAEAVDRGVKRGTGSVGVNVGVVWKHFTTSVYRNGDLAVLATREALQNSRDALREARAGGVVRSRSNDTNRPQAEFTVTWDARDKSLSWEDNGSGMDEATIRNKFLVLGESGKGAGSDAAGGFGVAKAVILGASPTFRWELHSRDVLVVSEGGEQQDYYSAPARQGTRITIYDLAKHEWAEDHLSGAEAHIVDRVRSMLRLCDPTEMMRPKPGEPEPERIDPIRLRLVRINERGWSTEEDVAPAFSRRGGSVLVDDEAWGSKTQAVAKAYRRPAGDRDGGFFVRLGGMFSFAEASAMGTLKVDVVVDLRTTARPGEAGYPMSAARDYLMFPVGAYYDRMKEVVQRENASASKSMDDEVIDPDDWKDAKSAEQAKEVADFMQRSLEDPTFQAALAGAAGSLVDFYAEREGKRPAARRRGPADDGDDDSGAAPVSMPDDPSRTGEASTAVGFAAATAAAIVAEDRLEGAAATAAAIVQVVTGARGIADEDQAARMDANVVQVAAGAVAAGTATYEQVRTLSAALEAAEATHMQANGGGVLGILAVDQVRDALTRSTGQALRRPSNPFGRMAGLRISKTHYDRAKARRFMKGFQRWVPYLVAWDGALRLVASEAKIRARFKPGFVLDDSVLAKVATAGWDRAVVYIQPDDFARVVKAHRARPEAVAIYLHNLACHELTHLDGRMGDGHDEAFVAAREDLAAGTAHMVAPLTVLVANVLGLERVERVSKQELERVQTMLAEARKARDGYRKQIRKWEQAWEQEEREAEDSDPRGSYISRDDGQPRKTKYALSWWQAEMVRSGFDPEAVRIATYDALLNNVDPTVSDDLYELELYVDALKQQDIDDPDGLDRPRTPEWTPPSPQPADEPADEMADELADKPEPLVVVDAEAVLEAAAQQVRAALGPGLDRAYFDAWLARDRQRLADLIRVAVAQTRRA